MKYVDEFRDPRLARQLVAEIRSMATQRWVLMDVCGVDYLTYGSGEWTTYSATDSGFSRGVEREPVMRD